MNNNAWFKKENPLLSLQSMGGGAAGSLMQGAASKTYVDDIFSTYLWAGDGNSGRTITNNIDVSGEGGLVWMKSRTTGNVNVLFDTARGANQRLRSDSNLAQTNADTLQPSFTSSGFTVGSGNEVNGSGNDYASWTFRKSPGCFDIVTWSGTSGQRTLNHDLGCVPGFIMLKQSTGTENWICYHRDFTTNQFIKLNSTHAVGSDANASVNSVSSTQFIVGSDNNGSGYDWVAYLFAGGPAANTEHSVDFDGTGDYLSINSSDFDFGTGDFTVEGWFKKRDTSQGGFFQFSTSTGGLGGGDAPAVAWTGNEWQVYGGSPATPTSTQPPLKTNTWFHLALVRHSTSLYLYVDGVLATSNTNSDGLSGKSWLAIGGYYNTSFLHYGWISNFRVVKGTAVYTSSFIPEHKALENISGTILLCCNQSTTTGSTITPATITDNGDPTASTLNPDFIDPESFKFGEEEDKSVISCGSYTGDTTNKPEINIGWEPQWMLVKNTNLGTEQWFIFDSMRGIITDGTDYVLEPSRTVAEAGWDLIDLTPTGFKIKINDDKVNNDGGNYIYIAIRRPDGYVGKPPEAGTDVFGMDLGTASGSPKFISNFPVDFATIKLTNGADNWYTSARLMQGEGLYTNTSAAEYADITAKFDFNNGYYTGTLSNSAYMGWMWKRHAGFDVVAYTGNGSNREMQHSLGKIPEMMWVKKRSEVGNWAVYHKGFNTGTNPEHYYLKLNATTAIADSDAYWNDTAPTSSVFSVGTSANVNDNNEQIIAMLFSSVTGISKCGYYTGDTDTGLREISLGFQPRFIIARSAETGFDWVTLDTTRGWAAGDDQRLRLNLTTAQDTTQGDWGAPTATGFTVSPDAGLNTNGYNYIYYAHA